MTAPSEYVPPTYNSGGLLPSLPTLPGWLHVPSCSLCGAVVLNPVAHTEWHTQLWVALLRS